jgi:hypothetical protein
MGLTPIGLGTMRFSLPAACNFLICFCKVALHPVRNESKCYMHIIVEGGIRLPIQLPIGAMLSERSGATAPG